jgi:ABC-type bacteriocin/lantibiotic exporter with double-glycine peptidase domain
VQPDKKKKSKWAKDDQPDTKKEYGFKGMLDYALPRMWGRGGRKQKMLIVVNFILIFVVKITNVGVPILLKYVVDAITCGHEKVADSQPLTPPTPPEECASHSEVYTMIAFYCVARFCSDFLNWLKDIPSVLISFAAQITVSHEVYEHIQSLSMQFHLNRQTGKIIRIVNKGSKSFAEIHKYIIANLIPLVLETVMVLLVFMFVFSW